MRHLLSHILRLWVAPLHCTAAKHRIRRNVVRNNKIIYTNSNKITMTTNDNLLNREPSDISPEEFQANGYKKEYEYNQAEDSDRVLEYSRFMNDILRKGVKNMITAVRGDMVELWVRRQ
jgi:hypothetical protein